MKTMDMIQFRKLKFSDISLERIWYVVSILIKKIVVKFRILHLKYRQMFRYYFFLLINNYYLGNVQHFY